MATPKETIPTTMETENGEYIAHCIIVPHPMQGHINPILQFAKRLSTHRLRLTFALTKFCLNSSINHLSLPSIALRSISDGFDDGGRAQASSSEACQDRFQQIGTQTLNDLLQDLSDSGQPVDCVIYDPFLPWVLDVAKALGLSAAAFFTQSCAVDSIYARVSSGQLKLPLQGSELLAIPGLPPLRPDEMPSFIYDHGSYPATFRILLNQFLDIDKADWVFINTFDKLEEEVINWMSSSEQWRVRAIGPTIPSLYLDKRLQDDKDYGLSIFNPSTNDCVAWLDQHPPKSVVYASFGSLVQLTVDQIHELALALQSSDKPFLWVVRTSEETKLPKDFSQTTRGQGLIVSWCPQLEVLAHDAVGCFVTHCGWNSTLEGLSMGVPMVAMPQWTDQSTNAKFVEDVWRVGVRCRSDDKGLVRQQEIVGRIKHVMDGVRGEEIRRNACKWKEWPGRLLTREGLRTTIF